MFTLLNLSCVEVEKELCSRRIAAAPYHLLGRRRIAGRAIKHRFNHDLKRQLNIIKHRFELPKPQVKRCFDDLKRQLNDPRGGGLKS